MKQTKNICNIMSKNNITVKGDLKMDEENKSPVDDSVSTGDKVKSVVGTVLEKVHQNKKALLGLVVVIVVVVLLSSLLGGGKKGVIKDFIKAGNNGNAKKLLDTIDMAGMSVFMEMSWNDDDLEDFYDEYKEFIKSDEWEEAEEDMDETIEEMEDSIEEPDDEDKVKIKEFGDVEKEGKNIWKVETTIVSKEDDDEELDVDFYVMKKGLGYKIVGLDGMSMF